MMPATYTKVPSNVTSAQRVSLITDVEVNDQINIVDILGRPARGLIFETSVTTDTVQYRLNNLVTNYTPVEGSVPTRVDIWSRGAGFPVYSSTGLQIETQEGLQISSVEITALTTSPIQIVVW